MNGSFAWYQVDENGFEFPKSTSGIPNLPIGSNREEAIEALKKKLVEMSGSAGPDTGVTQPPAPDGPTSAIKSNLSPSTVTIGGRLQAQKILKAQTAKAAQDERYPNKTFTVYRRRLTSDLGVTKFGTKWTDAASSIVLAVKPEIDAIATRFGVPLIRGFKDGAGRAIANMGDGVMGLDSDSFNRYAVGLTVAQMDPAFVEKEKAKLDLEITENKRRQDALYEQQEAIRNGNPDFWSDSTNETEKNEYRRLGEERDALVKKYKELSNRLLELNQTNTKNDVVEYDPNATIKDRPYLMDRYYSTGVERARLTMYHELGHHIHQMFQASRIGNTKGIKRPIESWLAQNRSRLIGPSNKHVQLSRYAMKNQHEWFAENFAEYFMNSDRSRVDPLFIELIETMLKGELPA